MSEVIEIQIAPDLCDISYNSHVIATTFNGMRLQYTVERNERRVRAMTVKRYFQQAIALSSKTHQIERLMAGVGLVGKLNVKEL